MKIYLKEFRIKYLFEFIWEVLDFKTLVNLGLLDPYHWLRIIKNGIIERRESRALIICGKSEIIGGISAVKTKNKFWKIGIFIFKKYRSKNLGQKAIKELVKYGKKNGWKKLKAETLNSNKPAQKILKKSGFKQVDRSNRETFFEKNLQ